MNDIKLMNKVYDRLQDEESKRLFNLRLRYALDRNEMCFMEGLFDQDYEFVLSEFDDFRMISHGKSIVIRGAGIYGRYTYILLKKMGIDVEFFCDNDEVKQRNGYMGKRVVSEAELVTEYRDRFVIVASMRCGGEIYSRLIEKHFPRENVFLPRIGYLYATHGQQYFDCPEINPMKDEIFVDCGCFDGDTSIKFARWCNNNYKKIYAFEPDNFLYTSICNNVSLDNFNIYEIATGERRSEKHFYRSSDGGSRIADDGKQVVYVDSLDNVLKDEKVTFIKLDVEGAELDTLKGSKEIIIRNRPRLAVCLYHKPMDILEIPSYILQLNADYKFYIRHYTNCMWETVLYAI